MTNKILCATMEGISARIVEVEATFMRALPAFNITGLANSSIQESKHRVMSALANNNIALPMLKLNINLFPSDLPKHGSHFDLPLALLIALYKKPLKLENIFAFGELGLDGSIKHIDSIYPLLLDVSLLKPNAKVILPRAGKHLFSHIPNLDCIYVDTLAEAISKLSEKDLESSPTNTSSEDFPFPYIEVLGSKYYFSDKFDIDFKEVRGQSQAKRAALIAAAGFHNIIFEGSPGCGKSMISKRMRYILPPLSAKEMIESVKLQALDLQKTEYTPLRNQRNPHSDASKSSILGSVTQSQVRPGEIALAHNGILFLDELPYFKKEVLESLREPLENNKLLVSRVNSKVVYDTSFLFIGALNPCPCGNLLSTTKECRCKDAEIKTYKNKLSEPFLDRMDLYVQMDESEVKATSKDKDMESKSMQQAVFTAFKMQKQRKQPVLNGKLDEKGVVEFCKLDDELSFLLQKAVSRFSLSHRGVQKVLKVSRTIADLDSSVDIKKDHLLEAFSYRRN
ncbi:YifB family Mg chelatase-like AAA ATPase [Helicobacter sp. 11S02629-2]|uniref:YifB family Mg chelatase-like AAA ATPase n=1 Tax=Helicobacter sp. 11S02629-2 TaxID=1476195 RepID=UPI000BA59137|nr:YifB family Mg chelatase-like AAA ATPase [Helicobacter sp. 11S02629-2]PAF45712.1 Fis family transcriptional regulator [Helicobacter sp. 11S02629-2]